MERSVAVEQVECPRCHGSGECSVCHGAGAVSRHLATCAAVDGFYPYEHAEDNEGVERTAGLVLEALGLAA